MHQIDDNHIFVDDIKNYKDIYLNMSAFFATNVQQITLAIKSENIKSFQSFIKGLQGATLFQHPNIYGELKLKPMRFFDSCELMMKAYPMVKQDSKRAYIAFYNNYEDDSCVAYLTAIKGDKYEY